MLPTTVRERAYMLFLLHVCVGVDSARMFVQCAVAFVRYSTQEEVLSSCSNSQTMRGLLTRHRRS